jgi:hypothetical protein
MNRLLALIGILLLACNLPAFGGENIGYPSPEAALAALRAKPGVTFREENDWIVAQDMADTTLWSITTENNRAHSTAVKRAFVERNGSIYIDTNILCTASKEICDQVAATFKQINADLQRQVQQRVRH